MKRFAVLICFLLGISSIIGCSTRWVRSPVVEQKNITVSLEHQEVKGEIVEKVFAHPFEIDPQKLKILLTQLDYLSEPALYGDPEQKPVFQADEVERLSPAITKALAQAKPHQRVRFISYNKGGGLIFKKPRKTRGIAFVESGKRLNLAFSYVNHIIRERELQRFSQGREATDPLAIKSSDTPLVAPEVADFHRLETGEKYPMWIAVDVEKIDTKAVSAPAGEAGKPGSEAEPAKSKTPPETGDKREKGASEETGPTHEPPADMSGDAWDTRKEEIKKKLEYLKELHESDLIDADEYDAQKKKLLDQLQK